VLLQFLIEAVVLAALGGLIGIVLATGASLVLAQAMGALPVQPGVNLLSFCSRQASGWCSATFRRGAPRMDPIEALRHE
jgi:putative ABC transport system permease protein